MPSGPEVARLEVEEVHERVVAEHPPEGPRVPLHVPDRLRRQAQGEPGPLQERGPRPGRDEHLAVREAAGRTTHGGRERIEFPVAGRTGGPWADERRRFGGPPLDLAPGDRRQDRERDDPEQPSDCAAELRVVQEHSEQHRER